MSPLIYNTIQFTIKSSKLLNYIFLVCQELFYISKFTIMHLLNFYDSPFQILTSEWLQFHLIARSELFWQGPFHQLHLIRKCRPTQCNAFWRRLLNYKILHQNLRGKSKTIIKKNHNLHTGVFKLLYQNDNLETFSF
jgi:hypothetical protein